MYRKEGDEPHGPSPLNLSQKSILNLLESSSGGREAAIHPRAVPVQGIQSSTTI